MEPHLIFFTVTAYAYILYLTMYFCACSCCVPRLGSVLGSGAFGEVYLAEADGSIISDNSSSVSTRHRLSYQKDARRRSSTVSSKGPIKVAVKTLKGTKIIKVDPYMLVYFIKATQYFSLLVFIMLCKPRRAWSFKRTLLKSTFLRDTGNYTDIVVLPFLGPDKPPFRNIFPWMFFLLRRNIKHSSVPNLALLFFLKQKELMTQNSRIYSQNSKC